MQNQFKWCCLFLPFIPSCLVHFLCAHCHVWMCVYIREGHTTCSSKCHVMTCKKATDFIQASICSPKIKSDQLYWE